MKTKYQIRCIWNIPLDFGNAADVLLGVFGGDSKIDYAGF